jgi:hypothetical protein
MRISNRPHHRGTETTEGNRLIPDASDELSADCADSTTIINRKSSIINQGASRPTSSGIFLTFVLPLPVNFRYNASTYLDEHH